MGYKAVGSDDQRVKTMAVACKAGGRGPGCAITEEGGSPAGGWIDREHTARAVCSPGVEEDVEEDEEDSGHGNLPQTMLVGFRSSPDRAGVEE